MPDQDEMRAFLIDRGWRVDEEVSMATGSEKWLDPHHAAQPRSYTKIWRSLEMAYNDARAKEGLHGT